MLGPVTKQDVTFKQTKLDHPVIKGDELFICLKRMKQILHNRKSKKDLNIKGDYFLNLIIEKLRNYAGKKPSKKLKSVLSDLNNTKIDFITENLDDSIMYYEASTYIY